MTATEELRRLLDERGINHTDADDGHAQHTWWSDGDHEIVAYNNGLRLAVYNLTPQQAIDATLGRGECRLVEVSKDCDTASEYMLDRFFVFDDVYRCSCGATFGHSAEDRPRFCPSCGRRVVEVGE